MDWEVVVDGVKTPIRIIGSGKKWEAVGQDAAGATFKVTGYSRQGVASKWAEHAEMRART